MPHYDLIIVGAGSPLAHAWAAPRIVPMLRSMTSASARQVLGSRALGLHRLLPMCTSFRPHFRLTKRRRWHEALPR